MLRPRLPSTDVQDSKSAQRFRSGSIVFRPAGCSPSTTLHLPIQKSNCRYSTESQVGVGAEGAVLASSAIAPRFQKSAADAVSVAYQFDEHGIFVSQAIVPHHTRILGGGREKNNTVEESHSNSIIAAPTSRRPSPAVDGGRILACCQLFQGVNSCSLRLRLRLRSRSRS